MAKPNERRFALGLGSESTRARIASPRTFVWEAVAGVALNLLRVQLRTNAGITHAGLVLQQERALELVSKHPADAGNAAVGQGKTQIQQVCFRAALKAPFGAQVDSLQACVGHIVIYDMHSDCPWVQGTAN